MKYLIISLALCCLTACNSNKYANETVDQTYMRVHGCHYVDDTAPRPFSNGKPTPTTAKVEYSAQKNTSISNPGFDDGWIPVGPVQNIKPNAYGLGVHSDQTGKMVKTYNKYPRYNNSLKIDKYGRPVKTSSRL